MFENTFGNILKPVLGPIVSSLPIYLIIFNNTVKFNIISSLPNLYSMKLDH